MRTYGVMGLMYTYDEVYQKYNNWTTRHVVQSRGCGELREKPEENTRERQNDGREPMVVRLPTRPPSASTFSRVVLSPSVYTIRARRDDSRVGRRRDDETTWCLPRGYPADRATAAVTSCASVSAER